MKKNNTRTLTAWAMYDWANSVYPLVISSAIFPVYYIAVTTKKNSLGIINDTVELFGMSFKNTVIVNYTLALSFLIICITSPLLSGIADSRGNKKKFMRFFCYMGAAGCAGLFFLTKEPDTLPYGILAIFVASLGFWSSLVFYNSFLPELATPEQMDRASAKGFSYGYLGCSLMLIICLIFIKSIAPALGFDVGFATRLCFIGVAIWWIGFAQLFFFRIKEEPKINTGESILKGFLALRKVWEEIKQHKSIKLFLTSFWFYSMGVQTVMLIAAYFGAKLLNIPAEKLLPIILIIQFVGIAGSLFFSWVSKKLGNKTSLSITLATWILVCIGAWFDAEYKSVMGFNVLAFFVGGVMGGVQSLSRSTYSKLIPNTTNNTASFFSFFDITEKFSMVIGLSIFAYIEQHSPEKGMQNSVLALLVFFAIGLILLTRLKDDRLNPTSEPG